jgi:hypothetical protein
MQHLSPNVQQQGIGWVTIRLGGFRELMKTLTVFVFVVILGAGLFSAGWRFGYRQKANIGAYAVPLIDRRLADAASKAEILHLMDAGHYSDARSIIRGQFNLSVLEVMGLEADWDETRVDAARKLCAKMVAYRNEYPSNYVSDPSLGQTWVDEQVDSYLRRVGEIKK